MNELIVKKKNGHKDKCRNDSEENNWNESTNNHNKAKKHKYSKDISSQRLKKDGLEGAS